MRSALISVGIVLALLLAAAVALPLVVDWNAYRQEIADAVEKVAGRPVRIEGDVSLRILPWPALKADAVRISARSGEWSADLATIESVRLEVGLFSLFGNEVEVRSIALHRPEIMLNALIDEMADETATVADEADVEPEEAGDGARADGAAPRKDVRFDSFEVEDGAVVFVDDGGAERRVSAINASIRMQSLRGPFAVEGASLAEGNRVEFSATVGRLDEATDPTLNLSLNVPAAEVRATFAGTIIGRGSEPGGIGCDGALSVAGKAFQTAVGLVGEWRAPKYISGPFTVDTALHIQADQIAATELRIKAHEVSTSGQVMVNLSDPVAVKAQLTMGRIDLDALLAELPLPSLEDEAAWSLSASKSVAVRLDLQVDALSYRERVLRQVRLNAALEGGHVTVEPLQALLPGGSEVALTGRIERVQGAPTFRGSVDARLDDLRGVMDWLSLSADGVPGDRLRALQLESLVTATPTEVDLKQMTMKLDGSRIEGSLAVALRERPSLGAGLTIDQLNVDSYLPSADAEEAGDPLARFGFLRDLDLNLVANVDQLTVFGTQLAGLRVDGTLYDGKVELREFHARDAAGIDTKLSGTVAPWADKPSASLKVGLSMTDATSLSRFWGPATERVRRLGAISVEATVDGWLDDLAVDANLAAAAGRLSFKGSARLNQDEPWADGDISAAVADAGLLADLSASGIGPLARAGALSAEGHVSGTPADFTHDVTFVLKGETLHSAGRVTGLAGWPDTGLDLELEADVAEPEDLAQVLAGEPRRLPDLQAVTAHALVSGGAKSLMFRAEAAAGPAELMMGGTAQDLLGTPTLDLLAEAKGLDVRWIEAALGSHAKVPEALRPVSATIKANGPWSELAHDVTLSAGPLTANSEGVLRAQAQPLGFDTRLSVETADTGWLPDLLGPDWTWAATAGAVQLQGHVTGNLDGFTVSDGMLHGWKGELQAAGSVRHLAGRAQLALDLHLTHPDLQALVAGLGLPLRDASSLDGAAVDAAAHAEGTLRHLRLQHIKGTLGGALLAGDLEIDRRRPEPYIKAEIDAGRLPGDAAAAELGALLPNWTTTDSGGHWSEAALDLTPLRTFNADLTLAADAVDMRGRSFGDVHVLGSLRDGVLTLADLSASLAGARLSLAGTIDGRDGLAFDVHGEARDLSAGRLLGSEALTGTIAARAIVHGAGRTPAAVVASLSGRGELDGRIAASETPAEAGWAPVLTAALSEFPSGAAELEGRFAFDGGRIAAEGLRLSAPEAEAVLTGALDLVQWQNDLNVDVRRGVETALHMAVAGPLDTPTIESSAPAVPPRPETEREMESAPAAGGEAASPSQPEPAAPAAAAPEASAEPAPFEATDEQTSVAPAEETAAKAAEGREHEAPAAPPSSEPAPAARAAPPPALPPAEKPPVGQAASAAAGATREDRAPEATVVPESGPPLAALPALPNVEESPEAAPPPDLKPEAALESAPAAAAVEDMSDGREAKPEENPLEDLIRSLLPRRQSAIAPPPRLKPLLPLRAQQEPGPNRSDAEADSTPMPASEAEAPRSNPILDIVRSLRQ